jgi:hypothetical protein
MQNRKIERKAIHHSRKIRSLGAASVMTAALLSNPTLALADETLDQLVLCSAIFNASVARTKGEELREDYVQKTLRYAQAAMAEAEQQGMSEQQFQQYALELGERATIQESDLAAQRSHCLSKVSVE